MQVAFHTESVPEKNTARIQECHIFLGHYIFQKVEDILIKKDKK